MGAQHEDMWVRAFGGQLEQIDQQFAVLETSSSPLTRWRARRGRRNVNRLRGILLAQALATAQAAAEREEPPA